MSKPREVPQDDPSLAIGLEKLSIDCGFGAVFIYTPEGVKNPDANVTAIFFARDEDSLKAAAMEVLALGQPPSDHPIV